MDLEESLEFKVSVSLEKMVHQDGMLHLVQMAKMGIQVGLVHRALRDLMDQ